MPNFNANLSMMFLEVEFLDRFEAAAQAGFKAVEFQFPYEYEAEILRELLDKNKLELKLFNLPAGDWAAGERGIAALPNRHEEFKKYVDVALDYAQVLNCDKLHCMSGTITPPLNRDDCQKIYIENLKYLAKKALPFDIEIMVEAINAVDMPHYLVNHQQQCFSIVQQVDMPNVKMQFDVYHCQMTQGNVANQLVKYMPHIGHIQIADVPGRHEPGTGEINYPFLFKQLDDIGYSGWIGCEYMPRGDTLKGLSWLQDI